MTDQIFGVILLCLAAAAPLVTYKVTKKGGGEIVAILLICSLLFAIAVGLTGLAMVVQ